MGECNPFVIDEFSWDVLKCYIKHEFGNCKLYNTTFFYASLTDETILLTLQEFYDRVVDYDGNLWKDKEFSDMKNKNFDEEENENDKSTEEMQPNYNMKEISRDREGNIIYEIVVSESDTLYMKENKEKNLDTIYYKQDGIIFKIPENVEVTVEEFENDIYLRRE